MKPARAFSLLTKALVLAALLGGALAHRDLMGPTPTEKVNAERQQQAAAAAQAAAAKAPVAKRLKPPCFVPASFYPYQTCRISQEASECGRGYLAWDTHEKCCAKQRGSIGAFTSGCTDFTKNVTCWVAGDYHPTQNCRLSSNFNECSRNWGRWDSQEACCEAGAAFAGGCSRPEPCWIANSWYPARTCDLTDDQSICMRGWGAFSSEDDCCEPGAAHSEGCGTAAGGEF